MNDISNIDGSVRLKNLVAKLTLQNSYWGYLFSRIRRVPVPNFKSIMGITSTGHGTLNLSYNPELVAKTEDSVLSLVLEHEGMHILNKHIPRLIRILANEMDFNKHKAKMNIWNTASDCCVNSQIKDFPKELLIAGDKWKLEFPQNYKLELGKAAEFYYHKLLEKTKFTEISINMPGKGKSGDDKDGDDNKGEGEESSKGLTGKALVCDHSGWTKGEDEGGGKSLDPNTLARQVENFTQEIARQALNNFSKKMGRGTLPAGVYELINELLQPPKAPYYQIIQKLVKATRISKFKSCSTRINRKRTYSFILKEFDLPQISPFPGKKRDLTFNIGVLIDTSGSQSKEDIMDALSGIKSLVENDRNCHVTVIENDTVVQKEYEIKRLADIQMKVKGRGGTVLMPGLERFRELSVDVVLGFTDGYCENLNELNRKRLPKKLIWAVDKQRGTVETLNRTGFIVRI